MARNTGTLITASVRPYDSNDTYAVAYSNEIRGGHHVVADDTALVNIPTGRKEIGMLATVITSADFGNNMATYQLDSGGTWQQFNAGGGGGVTFEAGTNVNNYFMCATGGATVRGNEYITFNNYTLNLKTAGNKPVLQLSGNNNSFMEFYTYETSIRKGYFGFCWPGEDNIYLVNEATNGSIYITGNTNVYLTSIINTSTSGEGLYIRCSKDTNASFNIRNSGNTLNTIKFLGNGEGYFAGNLGVGYDVNSNYRLYAYTTTQNYVGYFYSNNSSLVNGIGIRCKNEGSVALNILGSGGVISNARILGSGDVYFDKSLTVNSLAGSGSRMVVASSAGVLSTQAIPNSITINPAATYGILRQTTTANQVTASNDLTFNGSILSVRGNISFTGANRTISIAEEARSDGYDLTIQAQSIISITSAVGGHLYLYGGDAPTTSSSGGNVFINGGNGNIYGGHIYINGGYAGSPTSSNSGNIILHNSTTSAQVLIKTTTENGSYALVVNGSSIGTDWVATSDVRLKENINPLENSLENVLKMQGVSFNWKSDENKERKIGLIAQDVQKIYPEIVSKAIKDTDMLGISYDNIVAILIEAMKEQQKQIDELKSKLL